MKTRDGEIKKIHKKNKRKMSDIKPHRFAPFMSDKYLHLSQQALTDKDMPELMTFLLQYPTIKVLDLSLNNISDVGVAYFSERNQYVKQVNFKGNNISDIGIAVFAYHNEMIEQANFSHNLISDQGILTFTQINTICQVCHFSAIQIH